MLPSVTVWSDSGDVNVGAMPETKGERMRGKKTERMEREAREARKTQKNKNGRRIDNRVDANRHFLSDQWRLFFTT